MTRLYVYVSDGCWGCQEALRIVDEFSSKYPTVEFEVRDLEHAQKPETVFATPTYVLDDKVLFLGNPDRNQLAATLDNHK